MVLIFKNLFPELPDFMLGAKFHVALSVFKSRWVWRQGFPLHSMAWHPLESVRWNCDIRFASLILKTSFRTQIVLKNLRLRPYGRPWGSEKSVSNPQYGSLNGKIFCSWFFHPWFGFQKIFDSIPDFFSCHSLHSGCILSLSC